MVTRARLVAPALLASGAECVPEGEQGATTGTSGTDSDDDASDTIVVNPGPRRDVAPPVDADLEMSVDAPPPIVNPGHQPALR